MRDILNVDPRAQRLKQRPRSRRRVFAREELSGSTWLLTSSVKARRRSRSDDKNDYALEETVPTPRPFNRCTLVNAARDLSLRVKLAVKSPTFDGRAFR